LSHSLLHHQESHNSARDNLDQFLKLLFNQIIPHPSLLVKSSNHKIELPLEFYLHHLLLNDYVQALLLLLLLPITSILQLHFKEDNNMFQQIDQVQMLRMRSELD
jgi:hypothetical protein